MMTHMNSDDRSVLSLGAFALAASALVLAFVSFVIVERRTPTTAAAPLPELSVALSEFALSPGMLDIPAGGARVTVTNTGTMTHNLVIPDINKQTKDLAPGQSTVLTINSDRTGTFEMFCTIPGHAASGMKGMAHLGVAIGSEPVAGDGSQPMMDPAEMDRVMAEVAKSFPAKTEGVGGVVLEPKVLADGTKEFDLTASIVDWDVSPGKLVKAWSYNGIVPGPEIRVDVGDRVRVVLHNELPESTAIHFHGVRVPNELDGVPPYTQEPVKPGETFVYEFKALEPAVGMYHSHHDAQIQVPNGLAGAFLIGEMPLPASLAKYGITKVDQQTTMVLNDAGTIGLSLNGKSFPATAPYSMKVGETLLVHYLNEGLMAHPMHMHQPSGWIIAKDGVPLEVPIPSDTINIAPGERYSVVYLAKDAGVWAWHCHILNHAEGTQGMFGMVTAVIVT
jgi:manganese oxidase